MVITSKCTYILLGCIINGRAETAVELHGLGVSVVNLVLHGDGKLVSHGDGNLVAHGDGHLGSCNDGRTTVGTMDILNSGSSRINMDSRGHGKRCATDRWVQRGADGTWVRDHRTPRFTLFRPHDAERGPSEPTNSLWSTRITCGKTSTGKRFVITDDWASCNGGDDAKHDDFDGGWTSTTTFIVKTRRGKNTKNMEQNLEHGRIHGSPSPLTLAEGETEATGTDEVWVDNHGWGKLQEKAVVDSLA